MIKYSPLKGSIGRAFSKVWLMFLISAGVLFIVHYHAERVHTDIYLKISDIERRLK